MEDKELKTLAKSFSKEYVSGDIIGLDYNHSFPTSVKVIFKNKMVLDITSNVAQLYHASGKTIYEHKDMSHEWQEYVVKKAIGKSKLEYANLYLEDTLSDLNGYIIENEGQCQKEGEDEDYGVSIEFIEGLAKHANNLLTMKFDVLKEKIRDKQISSSKLEEEISADHYKFMGKFKEHIDRFLDNFVNRNISEQGEAVYMFTEEQNEMYETLKNAISDIDFSLRHKLYTLDNIKADENSED